MLKKRKCTGYAIEIEKNKMLEALRDCISPLETPKIISDREVAMMDMHWKYFAD